MYDVRLILPCSAHERRGLSQCPGFLAPSAVSQSWGSLVRVCVRSVSLKKRTKPKTTRTKTAQTYRINKFGLILTQSAQIFRMFANAITRHRTKDPHINTLKRLLRTHFMISWFLDWTSTHEHDTTTTHASIMTCCPLVIRPKVKMGTKNLIAWTRTRYVIMRRSEMRDPIIHYSINTPADLIFFVYWETEGENV